MSSWTELKLENIKRRDKHRDDISPNQPKDGLPAANQKSPVKVRFPGWKDHPSGQKRCNETLREISFMMQNGENYAKVMGPQLQLFSILVKMLHKFIRRGILVYTIPAILL